MDRRITFYAAESRKNQYGDAEAEHAVPLTTMWASVTPSPGRERLASAENAASALTIFRTRWSALAADINPKDEIEYRDQRYDIVSVVEIGRREGLEFAAAARTDQWQG